MELIPWMVLGAIVALVLREVVGAIYQSRHHRAPDLLDDPRSFDQIVRERYEAAGGTWPVNRG